MKDVNILFVCSMNHWRSPTGEVIFRRKQGINTRSAGTSSKAKRTITFDDIKWAHLIFLMEDKHRQQLLSKYRQELKYKKLIVLGIEDNYRYMDTELIEILTVDVWNYLKAFNPEIYGLA